MEYDFLGDVIKYIRNFHPVIFKQTNTEKRLHPGYGFRRLGGSFIGFSVLMFIFTYFATERNISGSIVCAAPFLIVGLVFLGLARNRDKNSIK